MKLRLRSYKTKETIKLEVPNPCTLQHLKQILSQNLPSSSQSSTIYLSLNQKDNLTTPSPQDSIQSIGITSGDLIYFTTNPNGFQQSQNPQNFQTLKPLDPNPQETEEPMETDQVKNPGKSFSVPGFLRKVFTEEIGDNNNGLNLNHKLLAIAVRAVLLESGFVEIDPISKTIQTTNNFNTQPNLHLASFHFTLPALLTPGPTETVKIKFQTLGTFCNIYGYINNGPVHSLQLNESKLVPFLNVVWANCGQSFETITENNRVSTIEPEREVFEFWRKTKDAIALPVLIDLCERTGIDLPPCFIQLPSEIKLKILDYVSGADVASVSCVCWELRYLGSSDELWKEKYVAEFGGVGGVGGDVGGYKERFGKAWEGRKRRRVGISGLSIGRVRSPFGRPYIIGGVHDIWPNVGGPRLRNARLLPDCNFDF